MADPKVRNTFLESYIPNTSISKTPFNSPVPEMTESLPEVPDNTIGREMPTKKLNSLPNCYFSGLDYDKQGHINNLTPQQTRYLYLTWKKLLDFANDVGTCIGGGTVRVVTQLDTSAGMETERTLPQTLYKSTAALRKGSVYVPPNTRRRSGIYSSVFGSSTPDVLRLTESARDLSFINEGLFHGLQSTGSCETLPCQELPAFILSEDAVDIQLATTYNEELWRGYLGTVPDVDILILTFLRARQWDLELGQNMLLDTIEWRCKTGILDLVFQGESGLRRDLLSLGKSYFSGTDCEGRLVFYVHARLHNRNMGSAIENQHFTLYLMELARSMTTPGVETATLIFDMENSGYSNMDLPNAKFLVDCFQNHYPETLGRCFIVSAPWLFCAFWKLVKSLLDPVVAAKIIFIDKKEQLLEYIPKESLLVSMGGENEFQYDFDVGLSERPLSDDPPLHRMKKTKVEILQLKSDFLSRKREIESLTNCIADSLEPCQDDDEESIKAILESDAIKTLLERRHFVKREFYLTCRKLKCLSEPKTYYHRLGVFDDYGNIHWRSNEEK